MPKNKGKQAAPAGGHSASFPLNSDAVGRAESSLTKPPPEARSSEPELFSELAPATELRHNAERALQRRPKASTPTDLEEVQRLVHELQVHQIELEMQNDELRRTQEELEASRAFYFDFYNIAPVGFLTIDEKGLVTEANLPAALMLGVDRKGLLRQPFTRFLARESQDVYYLLHQKVIATHEPAGDDVQMARKDGTRFTARLETTPTQDAKTDAPIYRIVLSDISDRTQAEEALHQHEEHLRLSAEHAPAAIAMFDTEMRYLLASQRWLSDYNLTGQNVIGRSHYEVFPDIPERWKEVHRRCLAGANERCEEDPFVHADGTTTWVRWEIRPWLLATGAVGGIVIFSEDITARKDAEAMLQRYELLARNSRDIVLFVAPASGRIVDANAAAEAAYGYSHEELLAMSVGDLRAPETRERAAGQMAEAAEQGILFETVHRHKNGHTFPVEVNSCGAQIGGERILLSVVRDISERKQTENVQAFLARTSGAGHGESFFDTLARYLAENLRMDFVCIDRLEPDGLMARTLAVWCDGKFEDNVTYALKDTPCGEVVGKAVCCYPASVCQSFPRDTVLRDLRAESYVGVTLWSHTGRPIGLIAVIGRGPLTSRAQAEAMLRMVAVRAGGELERMEAERALRRSEEESRRHAEELRATVEELNLFNRAMVGRELRMIELKKEINALCARAGEAPRYSVDADEERPK